MTAHEFQDALINLVEWPFDIDEVKTIESNCGSVWIHLYDGTCFFIMVDQCDS